MSGQVTDDGAEDEDLKEKKKKNQKDANKKGLGTETPKAA